MTSPKRVDKRIPLKVACWNVRTLQDSNQSECPQRKSALVALELTRLDVDIAALSEVRLANQGSLTERGAGYTLYWSGRGPEEHRQSRVAFMVKQYLAKKLLDIPAGHSDPLMSLRLPLDGSRYVTIISAYALTLQAEPETKEIFYTDLRRVLCKVDTTDKLIIMGDFKFSTLEWGTTTALDSKCSPPGKEQQIKKETTQTGPAPQQNADDEFQIAADLTLYANPLRCLHHKKVDCGLKDGNSQQGQGKSLTEEAAEEAGDIIAADLTMYGSPLDDN